VPARVLTLASEAVTSNGGLAKQKRQRRPKHIGADLWGNRAALEVDDEPFEEFKGASHSGPPVKRAQRSSPANPHPEEVGKRRRCGLKGRIRARVEPGGIRRSRGQRQISEKTAGVNGNAEKDKNESEAKEDNLGRKKRCFPLPATEGPPSPIVGARLRVRITAEHRWLLSKKGTGCR